MADPDWMNLPEIAHMDDAEFAQFWQALGTVVRIRACHAQPTPPDRPVRDPASTTAARTELAPRRRTPTGFGTGDPR